MAQGKPRKTVVLSLRVPIPMAEAIRAKVGDGDGAMTEWLTRALQQALAGRPLGMAEGFAEGKRQGWAHSNKVFREALKVAAEKLK
jgi:hypothetical protein